MSDAAAEAEAVKEAAGVAKMTVATRSTIEEAEDGTSEVIEMEAVSTKSGVRSEAVTT